MAEKSKARLHFRINRLPFLDGAVRYAEEWLFPGGACRNQTCYEQHVEFAPAVPPEMRQLLFTPETSGGLLVAVPPESVDLLTALFHDAGELCRIIGEVTEGQGLRVSPD